MECVACISSSTRFSPPSWNFRFTVPVHTTASPTGLKVRMRNGPSFLILPSRPMYSRTVRSQQPSTKVLLANISGAPLASARRVL